MVIDEISSDELYFIWEESKYNGFLYSQVWTSKKVGSKYNEFYTLKFGHAKKCEMSYSIFSTLK